MEEYLDGKKNPFADATKQCWSVLESIEEIKSKLTEMEFVSICNVVSKQFRNLKDSYHIYEGTHQLYKSIKESHPVSELTRANQALTAENSRLKRQIKVMAAKNVKK